MCGCHQCAGESDVDYYARLYRDVPTDPRRRPADPATEATARATHAAWEATQRRLAATEPEF